jgi:Flp pilus assembly protein TadG
MTKLTVLLRRLPARFFKSLRGNISIGVALTFIPFAMLTSAAVDMANAVRMKAELQSAADAGVLSAAISLSAGKSDNDKVKVANDTFYANLSPKLLASLVATPITTIDFPTKKVHMTVQVETRQVLTKFFAETMKLGVEATANVEKGNPICMMAMNKSLDKALNIQGSATISAKGCAVHANSSSDLGLYQTGTATAEAETFCVYGGYSGAPGTFRPTPETNCYREEDPAASTFAAAMAVTDTTTCKALADNPSPVKTDMTITPGVYCGGLKIFSGTVTMQPGTYVIRNGEFEVRAGATLTGNGVTILLVGDSTTRYINQGGANMQIMAPTNGPWAGFVIAQEPASIPTKTNQITGGGLMDINGVVYFPTQPLLVTGNGEIGDYSSLFAILADTISVQGTGTLIIHISNEYSSLHLPELPTSKDQVRLSY